MNTNPVRSNVLRAAACCALLAACSGERKSNPQTVGQSAVAVLTRVCSPDTCLHYLNLFPELTENGVIDRTQGIELSSAVQGTVFDDAIFIFDREAQSVQRYTLGADGKVVAGLKLSFQGEGLTGIAGILNAFASPTRAFMVDSTAGLIVTWNPTTMAIVAATPIPAEMMTRDGVPVEFIWPSVIGGRVYYDAYWFSFDTFQGHPKVAVLAFDGDADVPVPELIEDDRCGVSSAVAPFADAAGNVYVVGDQRSGLGTVLNAPAPAAQCVVRIPAGEHQFDPDYYLDLLDATGAQAISGGWAMNSIAGDAGASLLANGWIPSPAATLPVEDFGTYYGSAEFGWFIVDLATGQASRVDAMPIGGVGNLTPLALDGVRYAQLYRAVAGSSDTESVLYAVHPDGTTTPVLSAGAQGDFEMIGRVQAR